MYQIIENVQISKFNTSGDEKKVVLLDKNYTLDDVVFETYGRIKLPCGNINDFFELKDVNYVFLMAECPFNLLINDLVVINTKQFSFINPNKTITIGISGAVDYDLEIEYCYGLLKCGDQDDAIKAVSSSMGVKWDRVLKNVIFESNNGELPSTVDDSNFNKTEKFANFQVNENLTQKEKKKDNCCNCNDLSNHSAVKKVKEIKDIIRTSDNRIRYITLPG